MPISTTVSSTSIHIFCRLLGYDRSELIGRTFEDITHPDDRAAGRELARELLDGKRHAYTLEKRYLRKDGGHVWARMNVSLARNDAGEPRYFMGIVEDISESKRTARALSSARAFADTLVETAPVVVLLLSPQGEIQRVNPYFEDLTGYRLDEIRGKDWVSNFVPERARARIQALLANVAQGGATRDDVNPIVTRGGEEREIIWSDAAIRDGAGGIVSTLSVGLDVTERKRAEEIIRESEAGLRRAESLARIGHYAYDADGGNFTCSAALNEIWGFDPNSSLPFSVFVPRFHPNDLGWVMAEVENAARENRGFDIEYRIVRPNGTQVTVHSVAEISVPDGDGLPRFFGTMVDITDQKRAQEELRASEARLREAQRIAQVGSWELDLVGGTLTWSDEIYRLFEIDKDRFGASYEAFLDLVHPEDHDAVNKAYADSLASKTAYQITHRLRMPDGRIKFLAEHCRSDFAPDGRPLRSVGTAQDVTERMMAEIALKQFKQTLDQTLDSVFMSDARTLGFVYVNRGACEQVGYSEAELLTMTPIDIKPEFDEPRYRAMIRPLLEGQEAAIRFETVHRHKDGRDIPVEIVLQLATFADGQSRFVAIVRDVSERKRTERKLQRAKEDAEMANRAKSEFLSNMSHELRTPLNAILGFAQLLEMDRRHPLAPGQADYVKHIGLGGQHLLTLINDILDLAKIDAGQIGLTLEEVPVPQLVESAVRLVRGIAEDRGIAIRIEARRSQDCAIRVDAVRARQILLNLLSNAIKYNKPNGSVTVAYGPETGGYLRVSITDTGLGIPEERQSEMFKPFSRLGADRLGIEGTGIGLAITKRLTEAMAGRIGFASTAEAGSMFWVDFPKAGIGPQVDTMDNTGVATPVGAPSQPEAEADSRHILYVEDNPADIRLMEGIVDRLNHARLTTVHTAELGIELARSMRPDLILMDIQLPGIDGVTALRHLKDDDATRGIAVSANAIVADVERYRKEGFDEYVTKPIAVRRMIHILDKYLRAAT